MPSTLKKISLKVLKVFAWIVGSVLLLLVLIALLIQIPAVQLKLTQKAVAFLEDKIGTTVALEGIHISFPKSIVLEGLYLEDQHGDTLLYAGKFSVDTDLWALTRNEIQLNEILLRNTTAYVHRAENDSAYNFTYILEAFAGDSTAVPDTLEQKGWEFSLNTITLENIRARYDDLLQGNKATLALGKFQLSMEEFDLEKNTYRVEDILLAQTRLKFEQTKLPAPETAATQEKTDSSAALIFSLEELVLEEVHVDYEQAALGQRLQLDLGHAEVLADKIDLINQEIVLTTVGVHETFIAYHQNMADTAITAVSDQTQTDTTEKESKPWAIALAHLDLSDNAIQFYDFSQPQRKGSVDFDHLWISALNIDARDIRYGADQAQLDLRNFSFREQSGFQLKTFQGKVNITDSDATLQDLLLQTGNSRLQMQAVARYPSLKDIARDYPDATISADINESFINVRDILYFQPSLRDSLPVHLPANTDLSIDAKVRGSVKDINIERLAFRMLDDTQLMASGRIAGLPQTQDLHLNVVLQKFYTTQADMKKILPDTLLPDSLQLPAWVNLEAAYNGTFEKASFNTALTSAAGGINIEGNMNIDSTSALRGVDATLKVNDLAVGRILGKPDSVMGNLSMQAKVHTTGLTPEEMNGVFTAAIDRFHFQGYDYEDLKLHGTVRDEELSVAATMADQNLDFTIDANYNFDDEIPNYALSLDLKNADFAALNLSKSPIRARGIFMVDMATADFKVLNGDVGIRKVAIFNGDKLYAIDSLLFASIDQEGRAEINIDSDLLEADFEGSINIFALPDVMREYFHTYYALHDSLEVKDAERQHFTFDIKLKNTDLLTDLLIPELTEFVPGDIKGEFDSEAQKLDLRMDIQTIQYGNIGVKGFTFSTNSSERSLNYNLFADRIMVDSMKIDGLEFNGTVANDSLRTDLIILDSADIQKYVIAGTFYSRDEGFEFKLSPGRNKLNYQAWRVPENNYMRFGGPKFVAQNVELSHMRERISIQSDAAPGTPIEVAFRELNLEYLSSMIAEEQPLSGLLEGDINLYPDTAGMTFTSDLTIGDLHVKKALWGDLSLKVEQKVVNRFDVDVALSGSQNDVTIQGYYNGGETKRMDLAANFNTFTLATVQPLLAGQLQDLTGVLTGKMAIKGTPSRPDIDGGLTVKETRFHSTYLNGVYSIDEETISFIEEGISFDNFEVADNSQNKAVLDGTIRTATYRDFQFNLDLTTDNFQLLNTKEGDNELFYGDVAIEAIARIRGTMTTPVVDLQISLSEGSNLTYIVPQSEASVLQSEGIVKFVDKTFKGDPFMDQINREAADTVKSTFRGMDLTARIELSDKENFTIVIDPLTGDQLTIRGNTTLTLKIDPTGDIQLAGRYEISEGTYNLSFYKFVKREFSIESGSTITWSGDPMNANMDVRAIYNVETAPIELFSNQLTGADASEVNQYKQRLPFLVYLNITGELLQPEIAFELEMPMDQRNAFGGNVYARLQDINTRESDLNKQVFALLILKRFIADNPFENQAAEGFQSTARRSVSKILSEQLNRLSENIKGVELSFDIKSYEDYSTGQAEGQTELQLGVSKSLFNDRLVVKLSGNIDIEGQNTNREATDYIGDLALEYKITPDGRFRITGFRNSNYDMIDGELIETGAGLIYVKDYNSLSELFKANAQTKN